MQPRRAWMKPWSPLITSKSRDAPSLASAGRRPAATESIVAGAEDAGFHWVTMPDGVEVRGDELFDPASIGGPVAPGYEMAHQDPRWQTRPPGCERVRGGTR
jgi:hypothetical protein